MDFDKSRDVVLLGVVELKYCRKTRVKYIIAAAAALAPSVTYLLGKFSLTAIEIQ